MKLNLFYLSIVVFLFNANFANAQMGMMNNGMDRSIGSGQYRNDQKKPEKVDYIAASIKTLDKELTLDDFQKAVIKKMLEENQNKVEQVIALDIPQESKIEKITELRKNLDSKILTILNPEQNEKFIKMKEKIEKKGKK